MDQYKGKLARQLRYQENAVRMNNPPHPGETLRDDVLRALGLSVAEAARQLDVSCAVFFTQPLTYFPQWVKAGRSNTVALLSSGQMANHSKQLQYAAVIKVINYWQQTA